MVERWRAGGWEADTDGRRDTPGRKCFAAFGERQRSRAVGSYAAPHHSLAAYAYHLSSLSPATHGRPHLRQEPDAGIPLVRIRGGGYERSSFLLRLALGPACGGVCSRLRNIRAPAHAWLGKFRTNGRVTSTSTASSLLLSSGPEFSISVYRYAKP